MQQWPSHLVLVMIPSICLLPLTATFAVLMLHAGAQVLQYMIGSGRTFPSKTMLRLVTDRLDCGGHGFTLKASRVETQPTDDINLMRSCSFFKIMG